MIDQPFVAFDFSRLKRAGMSPLPSSSSSSSRSSQSQFVIDPVCSGRVKSRCLSSSHEERKGRGWCGWGANDEVERKVLFYKGDVVMEFSGGAVLLPHSLLI